MFTRELKRFLGLIRSRWKAGGVHKRTEAVSSVNTVLIEGQGVHKRIGAVSKVNTVLIEGQGVHERIGAVSKVNTISILLRAQHSRSEAEHRRPRGRPWPAGRGRGAAGSVRLQARRQARGEGGRLSPRARSAPLRPATAVGEGQPR